MEDSYDVVIVGGGPGGATAGTLLARDHRSVAIVDKARFPRDKPCAGGVTGRAARAMASVYGEGALARLTRASSTGCRMFNKMAFLAEARDSQRLFFVSRTEMDAMFLDTAREAGCTVFEQSKAIAVDASQSAIRLASGRVIRGSIILGADGVRSVVRESHWAADKNRKKGMAFGLVAEVPIERFKTEEMREACSQFPHIFFGLRPWGYGWIFPKGNTVSVGLSSPLDKGADLRKTFESLVCEYFCEGTWESLRTCGHLVPFGNFERIPGRANVLLVGDAARLAEPVTGEGIAYALESAQLAAATAIECLSDRSPMKAGPLYTARMRRSILRHFRWASIGQWLLFSKPCFPIAMRDLRRHPRLVSYYLELAAGKMSYPGYGGRMILERFRRKESVPSSRQKSSP